MTDKMKVTAARLVQNCREGNSLQGLDAYYDADVVSAEAFPMPGAASNEQQGIAALKGKHDWWNSNFEVHSQTVEGPFLHGEDRFSVIFDIDVTAKEDGKRMQMKEVAVYHCNPEGKIVREEFFFTPPSDE